MKQLIAVLTLALIVAGVGYRLTHHPVYGSCLMTEEGYICKLIKWEGNK